VNRRRLVIWLAIAFFVIMAALLAIAGVNFIAMATSKGNADYSGPAAPLGLAFAALCFFCFVLVVSPLPEMARKLRQLRQPRWDYDEVAPADGRRWRRSGRRSLAAPIMTSLALLMYLGVVAGFAAYAVNMYAQAALSSYVQHHGVHRTGGIVRVQNIEHQLSKTGPSYSAQITVALAPPINGHSTTVVHDPHGSNLIAGEGLEILVDPQQPGYAELPGQPFGQNSQWIFAGCFSLAIALVGVLLQVRMIVHMVRRYRRRGTLIGDHTQRALHRR
jgi:TRAP-type C4-dicarboxylate transport system permease small subunit